MIDRVRKKIDWPGRDVQSEPETSGSDDETDQSDEDDLALIDREREEDLRNRIGRAESSRESLEEEARGMLDESLDLDTDNLPQSDEAARMIGGTHPKFGSEYPELDEKDRLADGKITGEHFRRAYKTLENADRNAYGISFQEAVMNPNELRPFNRIETPMQAAGETDPGRGEASTLPEIFEKSEKEQRLSLAKQAAYMVGGFLLKWIAKVIESVASAIEGALSISIGPFSLGLGTLIAKPIYWLADWLEQLGEDLMSKGLGQNPGDRATPKQKETDVGGAASSSGGDTEAGVSNDPERPSGMVPDENSLDDIIDQGPQTTADIAPSGGPDFLRAAQRVVRSSVQEAERQGGELREAVGLYDSARTLKRDLDAHREMAEAWGVEDASPSSTTSSPERPAQTPQQNDSLDC
jgi:hypothetical protein